MILISPIDEITKYTNNMVIELFNKSVNTNYSISENTLIVYTNINQKNKMVWNIKKPTKTILKYFKNNFKLNNMVVV